MTCELCGGNGLLPFKRADGSVVAHAFLQCHCRDDEPERYNELSPGDYDFPCSDTFRGFFYEQYSGRDPAYIPPQPDFDEINDRLNDLEAETARPGSIPKQYHEQMQQVKAQVAHLQSQINHRAEGKQTKQPKNQPAGSDEWEDITDRYMR